MTAGERIAAMLAMVAVVLVAACAPVKEPTPPPAAPAAAEVEPQLTRSYVPLPDAAPVARTRGLAAPQVQCPPEFSGSCYPVWFGTNRKLLDPTDPDKGFSGEFDDRVHYGKRIVYIPASHKPGELGSPLWRRLLTGTDDRIALGPGTHLAEDAFTRELRSFLASLNPDDQNILVFIHGYNVSFDDAARRAAQLGFDLKVPGITALFSWPSQAQLSGYLADVAAIEASEEHIAQFLITMAGLAERGRVHIIAHSMGNRGLLRAMYRATAQAALRAGVKFGQIFLAAPDVDAKLFRQLANIYPQVAERTTLYVADQDKALAAMEWLSKDPKAGSAPPLILMPGIDTIRVRGSGLFQLGHSYVAEDIEVIKDIHTLLYWKESPEQRRARNRWPVPDGSLVGQGAWVIGE